MLLLLLLLLFFFRRAHNVTIGSLIIISYFFREGIEILCIHD
jgi:hypothetical protein